MVGGYTTSPCLAQIGIRSWNTSPEMHGRYVPVVHHSQLAYVRTLSYVLPYRNAGTQAWKPPETDVHVYNNAEMSWLIAMHYLTMKKAMITHAPASHN